MVSDTEEVPINPKAAEEVLVVEVDVGAKPKDKANGTFDNNRVRAFFTCKVLLLVAFSSYVIGYLSWINFAYPVAIEYGMQPYPSLHYLAYPTVVAVYVLLARWKEMQRVFPWNIVALNLLVFSVGYLGFALTWLFEAETIFVACAVVFLNSLELALFTGIFRRDIRGIVGIPIFLVTVFSTWYAVALGAIRWLQVPKGYALYAGIFSLLAMIFILVDLQLMMNGKNGCPLSPKDPLFATIRLFLDVPRLLRRPAAFTRFFQRTERQLVVVEPVHSTANKTKSFLVRHQYKIALLILFVWFLTFAFNTHPPHRSFNGECVARPFVRCENPFRP